MTDLKITCSLTGEERHVCHFQFTSWPDYGTPESALSMLQFLQVRPAGVAGGQPDVVLLSVSGRSRRRWWLG